MNLKLLNHCSYVVRNPSSENSTTEDKSLIAKTKESFIAGALRSMSAVVIHPLEVVKMRIQTRAPVTSSSFSWISSDLRTSGASILYRGLTPSAALVGFKGFYKYPLFVYGPQQLAAMAGDKDLFEKHPILFQCAMTPIVVGVDTVLQGPLRRMRNIMTTSDKKEGLLSVNKALSTDILSYWKGSAAAAVKQSFGVGSTLLVDALLRNEFKKRGLDTSHHNPSFFSACVASGIFLAVVNTPLDVVASRTSSANPIPTKGFWNSLTYIYKKDGIRAFTKGAGLRGMIYGATTTYTSLMVSWGRKSEDKTR